MKVYDTNENEMILEPSVKFAGNPNIIIAVKAFGLKATVQVCATTVYVLNCGMTTLDYLSFLAIMYTFHILVFFLKWFLRYLQSP
jgi:hypothetical protein